VNEIIADTISLQEGNDIVNVSNKFFSRSYAIGQFGTKADKQTTYTKTEVDTTFSKLVNSAPDAVNTLKELATALDDDKDYAATVQNQFSQKVPTENPISTGVINTNTSNAIPDENHAYPNSNVLQNLSGNWASP